MYQICTSQTLALQAKYRPLLLASRAAEELQVTRRQRFEGTKLLFRRNLTFTLLAVSCIDSVRSKIQLF